MSSELEAGFVPLFNGQDLDGWFATPRLYGEFWIGGPSVQEVMAERPASRQFSDEYFENAPKRPAVWTVEDGELVGRQDEPGSGYGGFLVTEREFGDFELRLEAKPDWPADSGILFRKDPKSWRGIQVLLDHRKSGSIGGFYGNGIGGFHAIAFTLDAETDEAGQLTRLVEEDPATNLEPLGDKAKLLTYAATADEFLAAWRAGDWNDIWIRVEGRMPRITTRINGTRIAEIDLATLKAPHYDPEQTAQALGSAGRIALEVHDNDPFLGDARWGRNSACRWRNIRIRELD
jgi:hypothetical protein